LAAQQTDEWMFGDALLVAPVLDLKAATRKVYLPAGRWTDFASGKVIAGGKEFEISTDSKAWSDIPLFVREGSILATEEPGDSTDAMHPTEITLDVFPSSTGQANWTMYDDDGATYNYEKGVYFEQALSAGNHGQTFSIDLKAPTGTYATGVRSYLIRLHGVKAKLLKWEKGSVAKEATLGSVGGQSPSWVSASDRFGDGTEIRVKAGEAFHIELPGAAFNAN